MNKIVAMMVAMFAFALPFSVHAGETPAGAKIGVLTCKTLPNTGVSLIIHSTTDIRCSFNGTGGGGVEHYVGETGVGFGVDMRFDRETRLVYSVFAAEFKKGSYKLAGKYAGVGASVTAGAGVGAQVLVGGNNDTISLQPVIEGSTGLGVSAGMTYIFLQPDKTKQ